MDLESFKKMMGELPYDICSDDIEDFYETVWSKDYVEYDLTKQWKKRIDRGEEIVPIELMERIDEKLEELHPPMLIPKGVVKTINSRTKDPAKRYKIDETAFFDQCFTGAILDTCKSLEYIASHIKDLHTEELSSIIGDDLKCFAYGFVEVGKRAKAGKVLHRGIRGHESDYDPTKQEGYDQLYNDLKEMVDENDNDIKERKEKGLIY